MKKFKRSAKQIAPTPSHWSERYSGIDAPFRFIEGELKELQPEKLTTFIQGLNPKAQSGEIDILMAGLKAWIICPSKIPLTATKNCPKSGRIEFVQNAMCLEATSRLARRLAIAVSHSEKKPPTVDYLATSHWLKTFPWEPFFILGGLQKAITTASLGVFGTQVIGQHRPVVCTAAMAHELITLKTEAIKSGKIKGENTAYDRASQFVREILPRSKDKSSVQTIRNYWAKGGFRTTAPLIYASTMVDEGRLFRWLISDFDVYFYGDDRSYDFLATWFGHANRIAKTLFDTRALPDWYPLQGASGEPLPSIDRSQLKKVLARTPARSESDLED